MWVILLNNSIAFKFNSENEAYKQKQLLNEISSLEYSEPYYIESLEETFKDDRVLFEEKYLGIWKNEQRR